MKLSRAQLIKALDLLKHCADPRSTLPACAVVAIESDGSFATLVSTDIDSRMTVKITAEGKLERHCVDLKAFATIVKGPKKRKGEEISIETDADCVNETVIGLRIAITSRKFRVAGALLAQDFPAAPKFSTKERPGYAWCFWPMPDIDRALRFVLPAVCQDVTRFHLSAAAFNERGLVATDGHRLHLAEKITPLQAFGEVAEARMRCGTAVIAALKACDAEWLKGEVIAKREKAPKGKGPVVVTAQRWSIEGVFMDVAVYERGGDHPFPPVENIIPSHGSSFQVESSRLLDAANLAVKTSRAMGDYPTDNVSLLVNGELKVAAGKHFEEVLELETEAPEEMELFLNGTYLAQALKGRAGVATISYGEELDPVDIRLEDNLRAIVMPLRGK